MSDTNDRVEQGTIRATHVVMCILNKVFLDEVKNEMDSGAGHMDRDRLRTKYELREVSKGFNEAIQDAGRIVEAIRIFEEERDVVEALEIISMNREQWGRHIADKERAALGNAA